MFQLDFGLSFHLNTNQALACDEKTQMVFSANIMQMLMSKQNPRTWILL